MRCESQPHDLVWFPRPSSLQYLQSITYGLCYSLATWQWDKNTWHIHGIFHPHGTWMVRKNVLHISDSFAVHLVLLYWPSETCYSSFWYLPNLCLPASRDRTRPRPLQNLFYKKNKSLWNTHQIQKKIQVFAVHGLWSFPIIPNIVWQHWGVDPILRLPSEPWTTSFKDVNMSRRSCRQSWSACWSANICCANFM